MQFYRLCFDRGGKKRTTLVCGEPTTNQRENLDKFTNPNNNINQKICKYRGTPEIDLASRISHQLPTYISWKLDPYSQGRDAFQISWTNKKGYAFPPFCLIGRVLEKIQLDQATLIVVTPGWQTQSWYTQLMQMSINYPFLLPSIPNLLIGPNKQNRQLIEKQNLQLLAWTASRKSYLQKDY